MIKSDIKINDWDEFYKGPLSEDEIRRIHTPIELHRISRRCYPVGTEFAQAMRECTCYVLSGACRFEFRDKSIFLNSGQFTKVPKGEHFFAVLGDEEIDIVLVWRLPFKVHSSDSCLK